MFSQYTIVPVVQKRHGHIYNVLDSSGHAVRGLDSFGISGVHKYIGQATLNCKSEFGLVSDSRVAATFEGDGYARAVALASKVALATPSKP